MDELRKALNIYLHKYYHILVIGDFNLEINERSIHDSCNVYNLERLPNTPTCFKNKENPSCIDLLLTNSKNNFVEASVLELALSNFHKLILTLSFIGTINILTVKFSVMNLKMNSVK